MRKNMKSIYMNDYEVVEYFRKNLYKISGIPLSRFYTTKLRRMDKIKKVLVKLNGTEYKSC